MIASRWKKRHCQSIFRKLRSPSIVPSHFCSPQPIATGLGVIHGCSNRACAYHTIDDEGHQCDAANFAFACGDEDTASRSLEVKTLPEDGFHFAADGVAG